VAVRTIDKATGLLAPPFVIGEDGLERPPDPETLMDEYFLTGSEPTLVASAQVQPTSDILLDLYGDDPADAELEGSVSTPEPEPGAELDTVPPSQPAQPVIEPTEPDQPSTPEPSEPAPDDDDQLPELHELPSVSPP
jgi:penicillin-binding protein 1A